MARKQKIVKLAEVLGKIKRSEMKDFKLSLKESIDAMLAEMDSPVGYAIVIWDDKGDMDSNYDVRRGIIGLSMVPTLVHDKLNRQIAQDNLVLSMEENV
jgi:hypothetical protein